MEVIFVACHADQIESLKSTEIREVAAKKVAGQLGEVGAVDRIYFPASPKVVSLACNTLDALRWKQDIYNIERVLSIWPSDMKEILERARGAQYNRILVFSMPSAFEALDSDYKPEFLEVAFRDV